MTTLQPGDRVNITIEDARVTEVTSTRIVVSTTDHGGFFLDPNDPNVTVTKLAPQPQAGEVWEGVRDNIGEPIGLLWVTQNGGRSASGSLEYPLHKLDFTGARCVYPPERATPSDTKSDVRGRDEGDAPAVLRRVRDSVGDVWTETAPGSGIYRWDEIDHSEEPDDCRCRLCHSDWERLQYFYSEITDLDPIPATEMGGGR